MNQLNKCLLSALADRALAAPSRANGREIAIDARPLVGQKVVELSRPVLAVVVEFIIQLTAPHQVVLLLDEVEGEVSGHAVLGLQVALILTPTHALRAVGVNQLE